MTDVLTCWMSVYWHITDIPTDNLYKIHCNVCVQLEDVLDQPWLSRAICLRQSWLNQWHQWLLWLSWPTSSNSVLHCSYFLHLRLLRIGWGRQSQINPDTVIDCCQPQRGRWNELEERDGHVSDRRLILLGVAKSRPHTGKKTYLKGTGMSWLRLGLVLL